MINIRCTISDFNFPKAQLFFSLRIYRGHIAGRVYEINACVNMYIIHSNEMLRKTKCL